MAPARPRPRASRPRVLWTVLLLAALLGSAHAQSRLIIDGRDVGEARTDVVSGHAYAPADALAAGLGATLAAPVGAGTVALTLGGHVVQVDVVEVADSARRAGAVRTAAGAVADLAGVQGDDALWMPVTAVAGALGAQVSYLAEDSRIVVVTRRPTLRQADIASDGAYEVLTLELDAPVSWSRFENAALGLSELFLPRALLTRARSLNGDVFRRVDLLPEDGGVRIRIDAPEAELEVLALPDGVGSEIVVRARPRRGEDRAAARQEIPRVVLDTAAVAATDGDAASAGDAPIRAFAEAVAERLRRAGLEVSLTRAGATVAERSAAGRGADLFASLAVADLPPGEVRVWALGDTNEDAMALAVRTNAATSVAAGVEDEVRRRILLGLVPDLEVGLRYGRSLATALFQVGGYRAGGVGEAPLAVLQGAAGRGVLIELSPEDVADDRLADALVTAIESALGGAP